MRRSLSISLSVGSIVALVVASACSSTLRASDYERSCKVDTDCEIVFVGDVCECTCDNTAAIARSAREAYFNDRSDITCGASCDVCVNRDVAVCTNGTCAVLRCNGSVKLCAQVCAGAESTMPACECPAGMVDTLTCR